MNLYKEGSRPNWFYQNWYYVALFIAIALAGWLAVNIKPSPPRPCNSYADTELTNIPARCVQYFTGGAK